MRNERSPEVTQQWLPAPAGPDLAPSEVHVYRARLWEPPEREAGQPSILSPDELTRAARLISPEHRSRFVAARATLRTILSRYIHVPPERIVFGYGAYGKPSIPGSPIRFNLSHSDDLALVAVTLQREIGVDLERVRPLAEVLRIAERFFTAREKEAIRALPSDAQSRAFYSLWTRKEAFIKAAGQGLAQVLGKVEVTVGPEDPPRILSVNGDAAQARRWALRDLDVAPDYAAALAVEAPLARVVCFDLAGC